MPQKLLSFTNPYLLLSLAALSWGGNAVAGKLAVGHVSPFLITTGRWTIACAILSFFAIPYLRRDWQLIRKHVFYLATCGVLGFTLFNNFLYFALTHTSAINASIEQASMPLIVFILNYILYKTRTTVFQLVGFSITLIGVLVTTSHGDFAALAGGNMNIGDAIMLFAIMLYGIYSVILVKKPDIHLISFFTVLSVFALIASIPFTLYEMTTERFILPDMQGWGVILYAAIFPSITAQLLWVMGLQQIGSNRGGLFINLVPVFGTSLAILILGESLEFYHIIGFVLVLGGIMLAQKAGSNVKPSKQA